MGGRALASPPGGPPSGDDDGTLAGLVHSGQRIEAIKMFRETHPALDLAAAKHILEDLRTRLGG